MGTDPYSVGELESTSMDVFMEMFEEFDDLAKKRLSKMPGEYMDISDRLRLFGLYLRWGDYV